MHTYITCMHASMHYKQALHYTHIRTLHRNIHYLHTLYYMDIYIYYIRATHTLHAYIHTYIHACNHYLQGNHFTLNTCIVQTYNNECIQTLRTDRHPHAYINKHASITSYTYITYMHTYIYTHIRTYITYIHAPLNKYIHDITYIHYIHVRIHTNIHTLHTHIHEYNT